MLRKRGKDEGKRGREMENDKAQSSVALLVRVSLLEQQSMQVVRGAIQGNQ